SVTEIAAGIDSEARANAGRKENMRGISKGVGLLQILAGGWCVLSTGASVAATVTWDGTCGTTSWFGTCGAPTNWTREVIPGPADDVSIPLAAPVVTIQGAVADASTISCQSGLSLINGGQLRLSGDGGSVRNLGLSNSIVQLVTAGTS